MREKICSLDLGNKTLKICLGDEDEQGRINILTKLSKEINSFKDGEIIDPELFIEEIVSPLKEISYQIGEEPAAYVLCFSSSNFNFQKSRGKISVSGRYIIDEDIQRSFSLAKASLASVSYEVLFEEPVGYYLDNLNLKVRDPLGMEARSLEVELSVIQASKASLNKIREFFMKNNLKIDLILPNPLPASFVLIPKKDKEQGIILIDFGYRIFNLDIFQEGKLVFYQNFKFGLGDILEDVALDLHVEVREVENALREVINFPDDKRKLKIKINKQKLTYSNFLKIIEKKFSFYWKKYNFSDLFKKIKENYRLSSGIYLIGGGSYLPEIADTLKKYSGYPVKMSPDIYKSLKLEEREFLNAFGAVFYYQKNFRKKTFWENIKEFFESFFK
jgi:cell division protein FtsA